jgi:hypothetical protein
MVGFHETYGGREVRNRISAGFGLKTPMSGHEIFMNMTELSGKWSIFANKHVCEKLATNRIKWCRWFPKMVGFPKSYWSLDVQKSLFLVFLADVSQMMGSG